MNEAHPSSGFALAATVFALVVLGVLVTTGFYIGRQETRIGVASERATAAFYMAERGAIEVMSEWDMATFGALAPWASATVSDSTDDGVWSVNVTKMANRLYFLSSTGGSAQGDAVYGAAGRNVGVIARIRTVKLEAPAAFSTKDKVRFVGKAKVSGVDEDPDVWPSTLCTGNKENKAGLLTNDSTKIEFIEKNFEAKGDPPILEDEGLLDQIFQVFGDLTWEELTVMADFKVGPRNFNDIGPTLLPDGRCNTADVENWGDPLNPTAPCGGYFPMIHIQGSGISRINGGGFGQGVLLVEGDFWAGGDFEFYGLIIVKGKFETGGNGNRVIGGVMAGNAELEEQDLTGGSIIQYSSCSLGRAAENNKNLTWVQPIDRRSWVDLSAVTGG